MKLDRQLQFSILKALRDIYPDALLVQALPGFAMDRTFMGNLFYLKEHDFITGGDLREPGQCRSMIDAEITRKGLDFLEDDGGLQAILNELVIRFERDDITSLILDSLGKAGEKPQRIDEIKERLEKTPTESLKDLVKELVDQGVVQYPELLQKSLVPYS